MTLGDKKSIRDFLYTSNSKINSITRAEHNMF